MRNKPDICTPQKFSVTCLQAVYGKPTEPIVPMACKARAANPLALTVHRAVNVLVASADQNKQDAAGKTHTCSVDAHAKGDGGHHNRGDPS